MYQSAVVTVGIQVRRTDSKWIPFEHRMFYCKQKDVYDRDWASEEVSLLSVLGGVPGQHKMKIDESRRYWATIRLICTRDYWGEYDYDVEFLKVKRIPKKR